MKLPNPEHLSPAEQRSALREGCVLIGVMLALAFILGVFTGAAGMEYLFWKWRPPTG